MYHFMWVQIKKHLLARLINISQITDLIFLGHFGREQLAAGGQIFLCNAHLSNNCVLRLTAIAAAYFNMIWYFSEGMLTAQDSLTSHAFGMRDIAGTRHWTYVSIIVMSFICVAGSVLMMFSPFVVRSIFALQGNLADEVIHEHNVYIYY